MCDLRMIRDVLSLTYGGFPIQHISCRLHSTLVLSSSVTNRHASNFQCTFSSRSKSAIERGVSITLIHIFPSQKHANWIFFAQLLCPNPLGIPGIIGFSSFTKVKTRHKMDKPLIDRVKYLKIVHKIVGSNIRPRIWVDF